MSAVEQILQRPAVIAALVKRAPRNFGRTALMTSSRRCAA